MAYCTRDDLESRFGTIEIADLLDQDNNGNEDGQRLDSAIADAGALVDGYIAGRYAVPLETTPALIKDVACDVTRYKLWRNRAPEEVQKRYDQAISTLRDISRGVISLPPGTVPPQTVSETGFEYESNERVFTPDSLADF